MSARELLRIALGGVTANTLRSGLTILGMTIGVAAVIVLVAVGNGAQHKVASQIDALGSNVLIVQAQFGGFGPGGFRAGGGGGGGVELDTKDVAALQDGFNAPDVKSASPVLNASGTTLVSGAMSYSPASFVGTTPAYVAARDYAIAAGSLFSTRDVAQHERVAVVGPTLVTNLFAGQDPIGQSLRVNGASFRVVGVTRAKGSDGDQDQDDVVIAPLTAVQDAISGYGALDNITVQATSAKSLDAAQAEVTAILSERHHVSDPDNPGFQVTNQGAVRDASTKTTKVFTTLLGAVAAISLLVGGIGVMNIMLVSVTERTREIGIRKAIGARRAHILAQFLTEAVLVSLFGGLAGVALGIAGSRFQIAGVAPAVAPYSVFAAFGSALLCGLFFGTYPAARAAALRPIDALRFE
jgi:putative ABC transport system permease protein